MKISPFLFNNYRSFLKAVVVGPDAKRGIARELSKASGCQPSYFSSALNGTVQLTPDHACGIAHYLALADDETEYFLLLVDAERAGSTRLRNRLESKLKKIKKDRQNISELMKRPQLKLDDAHSIYYSSWAWSAIHIIVSIPRFQDPKHIARELNLTENYVLAILKDLEQIGLVKNTGKNWIFDSESLHISHLSPFVSNYHRGWRDQAVRHSQLFPDQGIHYTHVTSVNKAAHDKIKQLILNLIDDSSTIAGPSEPEELVTLTIDFFRVNS